MAKSGAERVAQIIITITFALDNKFSASTCNVWVMHTRYIFPIILQL